MLTNKEVIEKYWNQYKELYIKQFNETPKCWFSYLKWIAQIPGIGNFNEKEIEFTKSVMGIN